jgi:hypothetical protein
MLHIDTGLILPLFTKKDRATPQRYYKLHMHNTSVGLKIIMLTSRGETGSNTIPSNRKSRLKGIGGSS